MTYQEYTSKRQEEFNALPVFYAFNDKQFEEGMNRFGLTVKDTDKIFRLGNTGGFYLKADSDKIRSFFDDDTLKDLMQDKKFAEDVTAFFASIHEQAGATGVVNPILSIYWSKAYDGLTDQPKVEVEVKDSLGERRSAQDIAAAYSDLPD